MFPDILYSLIDPQCYGKSYLVFESSYRLNSAFQLFEEEIHILVRSESLVLCRIVLILMKTLIRKTGICACSLF